MNLWHITYESMTVMNEFNQWIKSIQNLSESMNLSDIWCLISDTDNDSGLENDCDCGSDSGLNHQSRLVEVNHFQIRARWDGIIIILESAKEVQRPHHGSQWCPKHALASKLLKRSVRDVFWKLCSCGWSSLEQKVFSWHHDSADTKVQQRCACCQARVDTTTWCVSPPAGVLAHINKHRLHSILNVLFGHLAVWGNAIFWHLIFQLQSNDPVEDSTDTGGQSQTINGLTQTVKWLKHLAHSKFSP